MADNVVVALWPTIQTRVEKEWKDGYVPTAIRMNEHTRDRLAMELRLPRFAGGHPAAFVSKGSISYIDTDLSRMLIKVDPTVPDDKVMLQVDIVNRRYAGPVTVEVERPSGTS